MKQIIKEFRGEYRFLSNFYASPIVFDRQTYSTAEHLYQALKAKTKDDHEFVRLAFSPGDAKSRGAQVELRSDWEDAKYNVMKLVLLLKFTQHTELAILLVDTNDCLIQEWNSWGDKYWGICAKTSKGLNKLGILLHNIRDILREDLIYNTNEYN